MAFVPIVPSCIMHEDICNGLPSSKSLKQVTPGGQQVY